MQQKVTNKFNKRHNSTQPKNQAQMSNAQGHNLIGPNGSIDISYGNNSTKHSSQQKAQLMTIDYGQQKQGSRNSHANNTVQNAQQLNQLISPKFNNQILNQRVSSGSKYKDGGGGTPASNNHVLKDLMINNSSGQGQKLYNQTIDHMKNGGKSGHQRGGSSGVQGLGGYPRPQPLMPQAQNFKQDGGSLYTLTNTSFHNKNQLSSQGNRAQSDARGGGRINITQDQISFKNSRNTKVASQGNEVVNFTQNAQENSQEGGILGQVHRFNTQNIGGNNNQIVSNGVKINQISSTAQKNNKRAQSQDRAAAIHSSGSAGMNPLRNGTLDHVNIGYNPQGDVSFQTHELGGAIHTKKGSKSGMSFQANTQIEGNQPHGTQSGSVQTQRKRRSIMHDNLLNSRGTQRIQNQNQSPQFDYEMTPGSFNNSRQSSGIGLQSPPQLPNTGHQIIRNHAFNSNPTNSFNFQPGNNETADQIIKGQNMGQQKHFMQDVIERKIEKFQSQNANVQKRVNTSSKFRSNQNNVLGPLGTNQMSANHGPGTSGGQSSGGMNSIQKKKYALNQNTMNEMHMNDQWSQQENSYFSQHNGQIAPLPIKPAMKRPNTIANSSIQDQTSTGAPHSSGSLGFGGLGNNVRGNDKQLNNNNMTDIYDMLQKYVGNGQEGDSPQQNQNLNIQNQKQHHPPQVIKQESITFNSSHNRPSNESPTVRISPHNQSFGGSPQSQIQSAYSQQSGAKNNNNNKSKHLQQKFQQLTNPAKSQVYKNENERDGTPPQNRNLNKNLAKVKLNKIYDNRFFHKNGQQQIQGGQGSQGAQGVQQNLRPAKLNSDDELCNTSRMHVPSVRNNNQNQVQIVDMNGEDNISEAEFGGYRENVKGGVHRSPQVNDITTDNNLLDTSNINNQSSLSFSPAGHSGGGKKSQFKGDTNHQRNQSHDSYYNNVNRDALSQGNSSHPGNQSSRSYDSSDQKQTKKEMIRFLSRILDRNKPLFVFNTRLNNEDEHDGYGTPSFSMITLIHENQS